MTESSKGYAYRCEAKKRTSRVHAKLNVTERALCIELFRLTDRVPIFLTPLSLLNPFQSISKRPTPLILRNLLTQIHAKSLPQPLSLKHFKIGRK